MLHQEEIMWFQQAREQWITSGDRNTKFYHAAATIKKNRKRRIQILNENGCPFSTDEDTDETIQNHFSQLFTRENGVDCSYALKKKFPILTEEDWAAINGEVTPEEVKKALFEMSPLKAPGPDGFHAFFYQKAWEVVGPSVITQIRRFMNEGILEQGMNDTLIALIPKIENPTNASHFRPISLCNVIYKIITKTLTNRIKPIL